MKRIFTIAVTLVMTVSVWAQAPEKMSYQAVVRDANNELVSQQTVGMQLSILQGSASGTAVYAETQTPTTNINGLVSLEIGTGTVVSGNFATINWANGPYFIKTETDPTGGTSYTITGTTQLMSVPYALHAKTAGKVSTKEKFYMGQDTLGGIVYYLYKDAAGTQHGLIVNKNESSEIWQVTATTTGADRTDDGAYNTSLMTNSNAAAYVTGLGTGWYLPSIDELNILYYNRFTANKALRAGGYTLISTTSNWSSTEYTEPRALGINFGTGASSSSPKSSAMIVRAIRAF